MEECKLIPNHVQEMLVPADCKNLRCRFSISDIVHVMIPKLLKVIPMQVQAISIDKTGVFLDLYSKESQTLLTKWPVTMVFTSSTEANVYLQNQTKSKKR